MSNRIAPKILCQNSHASVRGIFQVHSSSHTPSPLPFHAFWKGAQALQANTMVQFAFGPGAQGQAK